MIAQTFFKKNIDTVGFDFCCDWHEGHYQVSHHKMSQNFVWRIYKIVFIVVRKLNKSWQNWPNVILNMELFI